MSTTVETRQSLPTGRWNLDPVHSQVGFALDYMVGTFRGSFSPFEAKLEVHKVRWLERIPALKPAE